MGRLWGDYWVPNLIGVTIAALIFAFGLFGLGTWLRSGEQVEQDAAEPAAAQ